MADFYTLADLVRVTGAKRRSLQLWADAGVIVAERSTDRAGTGTHRRFTRNEAIVACLIHGFALHQIAIGELQRISACIRLWNFFSHPKLSKLAALFDEAARGRGEGLLTLESWRDDKGSDLQPSPSLLRLRVHGGDAGDRQYVISLFPNAKKLEFAHLNKPEGFATVVSLKTYLSKIDS